MREGFREHLESSDPAHRQPPWLHASVIGVEPNFGFIGFV